MKKLFLILMMSVSMAFAMPAPSQIESALAAHDYQSAKSMTQEVLREKPDSAKAHLFNAYVILKTTNNKLAANEELTTAARLDKNGSVKNSALFGRTVAEIEASPVARMAPTTRQAVQAYAYPAAVQQTAPEDPTSHPFLYALVLCGFLGTIYYFYKRKPVVLQTIPYTRNSDSYDSIPTRREVAISRSYENSPQIRRQEDRSYPQPMYAAPQPVMQQPVVQQTGMTAMGTFAATAGGVVAGNALSDMLHHSGSNRHHHASDVREYREAPTSTVREPEPTTNYESQRSSYSSGSDDSWSSSSSSGSSSSSWDSGSSSSSSSDSSSSSGSWD